MTVQEFKEKIDNGTYVKEDLIECTYIPFIKKTSIIDAILDTLVYEEDGLLVYDTNSLELNREISFITSYTTLIFDNGIEDYDFLIANDIIKYVYEDIGNDICVLRGMCDNKLNDMIKQHNSVEAVVNRNLGIVVDAITDSLTNINTKISDIDTNELGGIVSTGLKYMSDTIKKA